MRKLQLQVCNHLFLCLFLQNLCHLCALSVFLLICNFLCHIWNTKLLFYILSNMYIFQMLECNLPSFCCKYLLFFKQTYFVKQSHPTQFLSATFTIFTNYCKAMENEPDETLHCKLQPEFFEIFVFLFVFYHFQNMYEYKVTATEFYRCACLKLRENLFF